MERQSRNRKRNNQVVHQDQSQEKIQNLSQRMKQKVPKENLLWKQEEPRGGRKNLIKLGQMSKHLLNFLLI